MRLLSTVFSTGLSISSRDELVLDSVSSLRGHTIWPGEHLRFFGICRPSTISSDPPVRQPRSGEILLAVGVSPPGVPHVGSLFSVDLDNAT